MLIGLDSIFVRQAFSVLKAAGCSDEALCYEMCVGSSLKLSFILSAKSGGCRKSLPKYSSVQVSWGS